MMRTIPHGDVGGPQQDPFLLVRAEFGRPEELLGPGNGHRWRRRWLPDLEHDVCGEEAKPALKRRQAARKASASR